MRLIVKGMLIGVALTLGTLLVGGQTIIDTHPGKVEILSTAADALKLSGGIQLENNQPYKQRSPSSFITHVLLFNSTNEMRFGPSDADLAAGVGSNSILQGQTVILRTGTTTSTNWTTLNSAGQLVHTGSWGCSGTISPNMGGTSQNDWAPTNHDKACIWRVTTGGGTPNITGIAGGFDGRRLLLKIESGTAFNLPNESASSSASNRILTPAGTTYTVGSATRNIVDLYYDGTSARWYVIGT